MFTGKRSARGDVSEKVLVLTPRADGNAIKAKACDLEMQIRFPSPAP
jgi:hypothetical protein